MYEPINPPKDFEYKASKRGAKTALLLNQLSGIPIDKALSMVKNSYYGSLLRHEYTKAWFSPEYWNYVSICEDYNMAPKEAKDVYDYSKLDEVTERFRKKFFHESENWERLEKEFLSTP